jgi:hypothetical protein
MLRQAPPHGADNLRRIHGLVEDAGEVLRPQVARVLSGDDDDGDVAGVDASSDFTLHVTAIETGEIEIEHDD